MKEPHGKDADSLAQKVAIYGNTVSTCGLDCATAQLITLFYQWQKAFFENGAAAFESGGARSLSKEEDKIAALEVKLEKRDRCACRSVEELVRTKELGGELSGRWVAHDSDNVIDFISGLMRTGITARLVDWMELSRSKYYQWRDRYGKANEHNMLVPRDHWLEQWEKDAIIDFHHQFPLEGYRRFTF